MAFDLSKIKSLFLVEEESAAQPKKEAAETPASPSGVPGSSPSLHAEPGQVSDKFTQVLFNAMQQANLPGLDYLEYKQSLNSLAKMPMDEPTRYQSAFAMAQAMGATPLKLIESAAHYLEVLKGEQSKFNEALRKQQTEQIGNREQSIKSLEETIRQKAEQIKKLTLEMEQHRQQADQMKQEIAGAAAKVESTKNNFVVTYEALTSQIQSDVENMKKYLK